MRKYNPSSISSNEDHMGKTPMDNMQQGTTRKWRAKQAKQKADQNASQTQTKTIPKKRKKASFLRSLGFTS